MHRSGKGTQLELLSSKLDLLQIPNIILRGDSAREGSGANKGDPPDPWWEAFKSTFQSLDEAGKMELIMQGARKIAVELIGWKTHKFAKEFSLSMSGIGVILQDRTPISVMVPLAKSGYDYSPEAIYGQGHARHISWAKLLPDLIIYLEAPQDILLGRAEQSGQDTLAKKKIIIENYDIFIKLLESLPANIKLRIIEVDGSPSPKEVSKVIWNIVFQRAINQGGSI